MAHIYPSQLLSDTQSAAERKLYSVFQQQLNDEYTVFHSVAWLARGGDQRAYDGEADFVIAHAVLGILVLEVKGGQIEYDGSSGIWTSTDRYGVTHQLHRDPFAQAKDARYNLFRKLRSTPSTASYSYPVYHAVCFPDVVCDYDLRLDAPSAIVIDQRQLSSLDQTIRKIFSHWDPSSNVSGPGHKGILALVELIAPRIELRSYLGAELSQEAEQIKQLTEEQFSLLDFLSRTRRALINGCAGSGKTMLAIEKARRLAQEGYSVLFTCFNARLAEWLNQTPYRREDITISHFHKLCFDMARRTGVTIPSLQSDVVEGDEEYYFDVILPDALHRAAQNIGPKFDALIVDEGQDFHDSWWLALEALLTEDAIFYIFCDDNQNIYAGIEQEYPFREPSYPLSQNCRNTQQIHNLVARYYRGALQLKTRGPLGRAPEFLPIATNGDLSGVLRRQLHRLVAEEQVPTSDIIVLSTRSAAYSQLKEGMALGNFHLTWKVPNQPNQIECCTIHAFKGLERAIVILVETEQMSEIERDKLLYIGFSRAVHHIILIGSSLSD